MKGAKNKKSLQKLKSTIEMGAFTHKTMFISANQHSFNQAQLKMQ